jgi:hypothetical protein
MLGKPLVTRAHAADEFILDLDGPARGTFTINPASLLVSMLFCRLFERLTRWAAIGDTVTWLWSTGGSIHSIAAENPQACSQVVG